MENREPDELRLLYSTAIEDIRYSKQQQWKIIHLTLLAIAALGYIHRSTDVFRPWLLVVFVVLIGLVGIWFLAMFTYSLQKYRKKKESIRNDFTRKAQQIDRSTEPPKSWWHCFVRSRSTSLFLGVFSLLIVLAGVMASYIILCDP